MDKGSRILVVGAGCFGLSTAYHLLRRGYTRVTILDRGATLPCLDAASTDLNKVVRSSYSDRFYCEFAREAIVAWKEESWAGDSYHESGLLVLGMGISSYSDAAYDNDRALGARIVDFPDAASIASAFPPDVPTSAFDGHSAYLNRDGGWAAAALGVERLLAEVRRLGADVLPGKQVVGLIKEGDGFQARTVGVRCKDGEEVRAETVVLAAGAWMASTFPELALELRCLPTGQSIANIQLTPTEASRYRAVPVVIDYASGFYIFPPNEDNVVKLAIHSAGLTHREPGAAPRTALSHGADGMRIPRSSLHDLRKHLGQLYPELAAKPFVSTRLCWYTDSPDGDWVIGQHPSDAGLVLATSGSGHAYKFLPVLGRLVADALEGTLSPALKAKFAIDRAFDHGDTSRAGSTVQELDPAELCTEEDLKAADTHRPAAS